MKKINWPFWIVLIIALPFIIYGIYQFVKWLGAEAGGQVSTLNDRLSTMKQELMSVRTRITRCVTKLRLTLETKARLDRMVRRVLWYVKIICLAVIGCIYTLFILNGYNPIDALTSTVAMIGLFLGTIFILFLNKSIDTNILIKWIEGLLARWIYKKHSFNQASVVNIQKDIVNLKRREQKLKRDIRDYPKDPIQ